MGTVGLMVFVACGPGGPVWSLGSDGVCPKIDKFQVWGL